MLKTQTKKLALTLDQFIGRSQRFGPTSDIRFVPAAVNAHIACERGNIWSCQKKSKAIIPRSSQRRDSEPARRKSLFPDFQSISGPSPTLLLVEHDPVFREFEAQTLADRGYQVLKTTGATEALALAHTTVAIHLLLTDFAIPEVDGLALIEQFRAVRPETPVLMFADDSLWFDARTKKPNHFAVVAKPFDIQELVHKVRVLLEAAVAPPRSTSPRCN